ncbi:MAG TPA: flagellar hook-associated protein FlgK, partial [Actinomycetota bacterium]
MSDAISLYTALSGLQAARARMEVASNNVANVSTTGYTRQRADLNPREHYQATYGFMGSGVTMSGVVRMRDSFLDSTFRSASDLSGRSSIRAELLGRAETALAEPDQGITGPLADLWSSFEDLASNPTNAGSRASVLGAIDDVATRVREVAAGWDRLAGDAKLRMQDQLSTVNDMLAQVADLNRAIVEASGNPGAQPNDLLDRRDILIDSLASSIGASAVTLADGTVKVSLDGVSLADGVTATSLTLGSDGAVRTQSAIELNLGGEIGGFHDFLVVDLPSLRANLDQLAEDLAGALNTQHEAGWVSDTEAGGPLLSYTPGSAAASLKAVITDPGKLALSGTQGPPFPAFDVDNMHALANLRTALAANGGTATLAAAAGGIAVQLGSAAATSKRAADSQLSIASAAEAARQSGHGVSLDEEMTELMSAQHAYEAAARVMTTVDQSLDTLIN